MTVNNKASRFYTKWYHIQNIHVIEIERHTNTHMTPQKKREVYEEKDEKVYLFRQKLFCVISSSEADARKCVLFTCEKYETIFCRNPSLSTDKRHEKGSPKTKNNKKLIANRSDKIVTIDNYLNPKSDTHTRECSALVMSK